MKVVRNCSLEKLFFLTDFNVWTKAGFPLANFFVQSDISIVKIKYISDEFHPRAHKTKEKSNFMRQSLQEETGF